MKRIIKRLLGKRYSISKKRYQEFQEQFRYTVKVCKLYMVHWTGFTKKKKSIIIHAWVETDSYTMMVHNNWGDDLNKYLIELMTERRSLFLPAGNFDKLFSFPRHYIFIGSIISFYNLNNSIIWGAGLKNPRDILTGTPKKVLMVRGPKTRECLLERGIDCPECYGDPALLLPLYYKPQINEQDRVTVIVHESTPDDNMIVNEFRRHGYRIVSMKKYQRWTDIIDSIVNSKYIISESLHGLIASEAYRIPSIWVEIIPHFDMWSFKFQDFYESIGKYGMESIKLFENFNLQAIEKKVRSWSSGDIDYKTMLDCFPLKIHK